MKTIVFVGGGTLGPVTPLIAVARKMKKMDERLALAWVGTSDGPEQDVVTRERIPFSSIPSVKVPRFLSWDWLTLPQRYFAARRAAREILDRVKPSLVVGVGGFTQVPLMIEASKRKIPCAIHQLDAEPGLSNVRVAPLCASVTTSFAYPHPPFGRVPSEQIATPCRYVGVTVPDREAGCERFFLDHDKQTVFVFGGGTGSVAINEAIRAIKSTLMPNVQIIHQTGKGKRENDTAERGYVVKELFDEQDMLFAYASADVVVCRAGLGTFSDLATLKKPAIVVPMPDTHQERNVEAVKEGIVPLQQSARLGEDLRAAITTLLIDRGRRNMLGENLHQLLPTDDGTALAERWLRLVERE